MVENNCLLVHLMAIRWMREMMLFVKQRIGKKGGVEELSDSFVCNNRNQKQACLRMVPSNYLNIHHLKR